MKIMKFDPNYSGPLELEGYFDKKKINSKFT